MTAPSARDRIREAGEKAGWTAHERTGGITLVRDGTCTIVAFSASGAVLSAWQHEQGSSLRLREAAGKDRAWQVICWLQGEPERFRSFQDVTIHYPNPVLWVTYRRAMVLQDDGGPKVKVQWRAEDGPRIARNVVLYHGDTHEQWIPRERLSAKGH